MSVSLIFLLFVFVVDILFLIVGGVGVVIGCLAILSVCNMYHLRRIVCCVVIVGERVAIGE